jgi:glycosyltransferase involved in cell wall biosynthesis
MNKIIEISIVLPVFNEGENIAKQIKELEKTIILSHEILIVYDFDEDNTVPVVKGLKSKYKNIKLLKNIYGRGLINAVKTGFNKASGKVIVVMPADLADDPRTILKMYQKIQEGYDIVAATRYTKGGKKIGGEYLKSMMSRVAGLLTPILLGIPITDISNGFKMYRAIVIESIPIKSNGGWEFSTELVVKANQRGLKIAEVPTIWKNRIRGMSKFKLLKWLPKYLRWYFVGILMRLHFYRGTD